MPNDKPQANPPEVNFAALSADVLHQLKTELDSFIEQASQDHFDMDKEDSALMRAALSFRSCPEETYVIVVAIHRDPRKNQLTRIRCHKGHPLGGYAYDNVNDAYQAECADHFALGLVPISFQINLGGWTSYVPMPEAVLMKYLSDKQKQNLAAYKANFPPGEFSFEFMQLLH